MPKSSLQPYKQHPAVPFFACSSNSSRALLLLRSARLCRRWNRPNAEVWRVVLCVLKSCFWLWFSRSLGLGPLLSCWARHNSRSLCGVIKMLSKKKKSKQIPLFCKGAEEFYFPQTVVVSCLRGLIVLILYQLHGVHLANWADENSAFCNNDRHSWWHFPR